MQGVTLRLSGGDRPALVVGASTSALTAVAALRQAGMPVRLCAMRRPPDPARLTDHSDVDWCARAFTTDDVRAARLVIAADEDEALNTRVRHAARRADKLFLDATTGVGDFELLDTGHDDRQRDDLWQHAQVCLVGAGPGDPGLLTLDGRQALAGCDVVLYDRLVAPALLDFAPAAATRRFVGKQRDNHHMRQPALNALMIELAGKGRRVVRLKGGDPFVFGRGGEELVELARAGVATRVIPGITAGSGCATYADIPLTHRGVAASVQFLTAHGRDGELDHDWTSLVRGGHTLVVYMGVMALENLCPALTRHGMQRDTPAALIERGTTPEQRVLTGTVTTLPGIAARHTVTSPAVLIVGDVVNLRDVIGQARLIESADQTAVAPGSPRAYGI